MDAVPGGLRRPGAHQVGVPGEVTDAGVDLGQPYPQLRPLLLIAHGPSLVVGTGGTARRGTVDGGQGPS